MTHKSLTYKGVCVFVSIFVKFQVDAILNALPLVIIPVQCVCKFYIYIHGHITIHIIIHTWTIR
jgi:hypothetical protein